VHWGLGGRNTTKECHTQATIVLEKGGRLRNSGNGNPSPGDIPVLRLPQHHQLQHCSFLNPQLCYYTSNTEPAACPDLWRPQKEISSLVDSISTADN